jgi:hypothetical protein
VAYVSVEGTLRSFVRENYYSETPKTGYRDRKGERFNNCYHVANNTESGSLYLDKVERALDDRRQYKAIGGL